MCLCKSLKVWAVPFLGCGFTMHLVLLFLACADRWHTGMLQVLGCPVLTSVVPAMDGCKGLATGGSLCPACCWGTWDVTPVQLFKLQQLRHCCNLPQLMCQQEHDHHHWGQVGFGSVGSHRVRGEAHGWESMQEKFVALVTVEGLWSLADL